MLKKTLLAIGLLAGLSATAQAASTISDKSYWPSEATQNAQSGAVVSQHDLNSAFAYDHSAPAQPTVTAGGPTWRYQGGPKSR